MHVSCTFRSLRGFRAEAEIARTQKNKATEGHLGMLKARLAKLKTQQLEGAKGSGGKGEGWEVEKSGDARVALIGYVRERKTALPHADPLIS